MGAVDFIRSGEWLHRGRVRGYLRVIAAVHVLALVAYLATSHDGLDANGYLLGTDFVSFWSAGQMLAGHADVYDKAAHIAVQKAYYPTGIGYAAFFYPPTFLPFCLPFGYLPYFPALGLWLGITGAAYGAAIRAWFVALDIDINPWLAMAAFSPVLITLMHGQTSFLVSALLGLGVLLVERRPWLAGALFGLAVFKPQFGMLIPVVLLVTREWRVIAAAAGSAIALALVSTAAFGTDVWARWLEASGRAGEAMTSGAIGFGKMQSPYAALRLLGSPPAAAYAAQILVTTAILAILVWAASGRRFDRMLGCAMLAATPLATPFVLDYDLTVLAFPVILLGAIAARPWERLAAVLAFAVALYARTAGLALGLPITPLVLALLFGVLIARLRSEALQAAPA